MKIDRHAINQKMENVGWQPLPFSLDPVAAPYSRTPSKRCRWQREHSRARRTDRVSTVTAPGPDQAVPIVSDDGNDSHQLAPGTCDPAPQEGRQGACTERTPNYRKVSVKSQFRKRSRSHRHKSTLSMLIAHSLLSIVNTIIARRRHFNRTLIYLEGYTLRVLLASVSSNTAKLSLLFTTLLRCGSLSVTQSCCRNHQ